MSGVFLITILAEFGVYAAAVESLWHGIESGMKDLIHVSPDRKSVV